MLPNISVYLWFFYLCSYNILHDLVDMLSQYNYDWFLNLIVNFFDYNNAWFFNFVVDNYYFVYNTDYSLIITLKVSLCLAFLIVIRGCIPRYRYDFLTKMGWVKFLGYILTIFLITVLFCLI